MPYLPGDKIMDNRPSINHKALKINLNKFIYGTFAEIGAGQEVARHFFRVGSASGTIAKTMSAYDRNFSNTIYGQEKNGQYVSEFRLHKMLIHEIELLEKRIPREENPEKLFFTLANTVATIDFAKRYRGHGWMGIRYQLEPNQEYSEIIIHVRFKQLEARLQQEVIGILGVNLVYGAFYYHDNPKAILKFLYDHIDHTSIEIDTINFSGPIFEKVDNRLMSLELIRNNMTEAVMFDPNGSNVMPSRVLYDKNILTLRGSFRPVTKVNIDMLEKSYEVFLCEKNVTEENTQVIFEITLSNLLNNGKEDGTIDEKDFMDRAKLLCSLGHTVMISHFQEYYRLVSYFSEYTKKQMGLCMGVDNFLKIFVEDYYQDVEGGILEAFGKMFRNNLKVYLYPLRDEQTGTIIQSNNLKLKPRMKDFYKFFKYNNKIVDILDYDEGYLDIYSREVLHQIKTGGIGWEEKLPKGIAELIIHEKMFGLNSKTNSFQ